MRNTPQIHGRRLGLLLGIQIVLVLSAPCWAQTSVDLDALDQYFQSAKTDWNVPGIAVAIVKDGETVLARGYGVRTIGEEDPVDEHTLFAIASNTKAFTAAALAKLVDEGKISWDDRVIDHLPYFQLYSPYVTREMRIRDLLSHRSGLGTYSGDLLWYGTSYSREEVVRRARHLKPAGDFRASYGYSNLMFITAGEVVTAAAGRSWDEVIEAEFFDPLGMDRSVTSVKDLEGKTNVATPHGETEGRIVTFPWYGWDSMAAAGGIISSVSEMSHWLKLQLNRGTLSGKTYFSEEQSRAMWTVHTPRAIDKVGEERYPTTHFRGYGLGWDLMDYQGRKVVSHSGGYDGMFSRLAMVPEEKLGVVILTNSMTSIATALMYRVLDAYLGGGPRDWSKEFLDRSNKSKEETEQEWAERAADRVEDTEPSLPLKSYTGTYGGDLYGDATVTLENGHLVIQFLPAPDFVGDLTHWHFDTFEIKWRHAFPWFGKGDVQFLMDAMGHVSEMKVDVPNDDFWFTELDFKKKE